MCPTRYRTLHFFNNSNTNEDYYYYYYYYYYWWKSFQASVSRIGSFHPYWRYALASNFPPQSAYLEFPKISITVVYAVRRWPKRRYAGHECVATHTASTFGIVFYPVCGSSVTLLFTVYPPVLSPPSVAHGTVIFCSSRVATAIHLHALPRGVRSMTRMSDVCEVRTAQGMWHTSCLSISLCWLCNKTHSCRVQSVFPAVDQLTDSHESLLELWHTSWRSCES